LARKLDHRGASKALSIHDYSGRGLLVLIEFPVEVAIQRVSHKLQCQTSFPVFNRFNVQFGIIPSAECEREVTDASGIVPAFDAAHEAKDEDVVYW
jgi:hypothetical protein